MSLPNNWRFVVELDVTVQPDDTMDSLTDHVARVAEDALPAGWVFHVDVETREFRWEYRGTYEVPEKKGK